MTDDNKLIALLDDLDAWLPTVQQQIIGAKASRNIATLSAALRELLTEPRVDWNALEKRIETRKASQENLNSDEYNEGWNDGLGEVLYKVIPEFRASSPSSLAGDKKTEGKSELEAAYHAAVRAGLSSTEGRTFAQWRDKVSDYGLDDAQQALAVERERAK